MAQTEQLPAAWPVIPLRTCGQSLDHRKPHVVSRSSRQNVGAVISGFLVFPACAVIYESSRALGPFPWEELLSGVFTLHAAAMVLCQLKSSRRAGRQEGLRTQRKAPNFWADHCVTEATCYHAHRYHLALLRAGDNGPRMDRIPHCVVGTTGPRGVSHWRQMSLFPNFVSSLRSVLPHGCSRPKTGSLHRSPSPLSLHLSLRLKPLQKEMWEE